MMSELESKYLLDECVLRTPERIKSNTFPQAIDYLPKGSPDDKVLEEAIKRGLILVTRDMKFVVRTVRQGHPVIYDYGGHWHLIDKVLIDNPFDEVGIYCRHNDDSIIIP